MKQQQYQRIEAGGNPRLETLELVAEGLEAELLLVPKNKLRKMKALLTEQEAPAEFGPKVDEDPWFGLLD